MAMYTPQPPSPPKFWDSQQPTHSPSRDFAPPLDQRQSQFMATTSSRELPNVPGTQFEHDQDFYDDHSPEREDDNDDFFNGASNQNGGLHPNGPYNPAADYRNGSVATQS